MSPYEVTFHGPEESPVVRDNASGRDLVLDPNDADYCKFLTWAAAQPEPPAPFRNTAGAGTFCATAEHVVRECKEGRIILEGGGFDSTDAQLSTWTRFHQPIGRNTQGFVRLPSFTARSADERDGSRQIEPSVLAVGDELFAQLEVLVQDDNSEIRKLSSIPVERAFVYVDVSDFSTHKPQRQLLVVATVIDVARSIFAEHGLQAEAQLCIGDGYIYVFDAARTAALFAKEFAAFVERGAAKNELRIGFHFRIAVHVGSVFRFWDPGREDWNYVGDGINDGSRVLEAVGKDTDDVVFLSGQARDKLLADEGRATSEQMLRAMISRGRRNDKHGKAFRVYELNHTAAAGYP